MNSANQDVTDAPPTLGRNRGELPAQFMPLAPGTDTVKSSVAATDGHRTGGSYIFTVAGRAGKSP